PDGVLSAQNFEWRVVLLHLSHSHPEAGPINATSGNFQIPTTGHEINDEIQFRFILKVTDSDGLTTEQAIDIYPETVNLIFQSSPSGLTISVDGMNKTTPYTLNTAINFQHQITAPNSQSKNGVNYNFVNWSHGQNQNQFTISAPAYDQAYTANYGATNVGVTPLYGYSLDEGAGTIAQSSFTQNTLNLINGPSWIPNARYNGGLSFDGTNDRATGGSFTLPSAFTFMAWVRNPSNNPYETLISVGANRDLYLNNGQISFYDGINERAFGNAISTNTWHHVAIVSTGSQIRAYLNGNQVGNTVTANLSSYSGNLHLGAWPYNNSFTDFLSGTLDDVRIYNLALTQTEIQSAMNSAIGQTQAPTNLAPTTQNQTVNAIKNNTTVFTLNATDNENNPLTYHIVTNTQNGTLSLNQNQAVYTPNPNFTGSDSFAFRVNDGTYFSNTSVVTINVLNLPSGGYAIKFNGNGTNDIDRIKIPIDNPETPVDVGQGDFTIEWWMKANDTDNLAGNCITGNDGWINGNIIIDRDVYGNGDYGDFGVSVFNNGLAFGVNNGTSGSGICGNTKVDDGNWHHIAVTRNASTGQIRIFVDGVLDAQGTGPTGNISYRNGRTTNYPNDRFLVLGAEKHDAGPQYPSYNGEIDELRISNNIRYVSNFQRPISPFASDSNTLALYNFNEGSGTTVYDSNQNGTKTNGQIFYGGNPAGPIYVVSSIPFNESGNMNTPPIANDDNVETNEDTPVTISVLNNDTDPDGNNLTVTNVANVSGGTVSINSNSTINFVPQLNFNGIAQFTYTISDGQGGTDSANVNIAVLPVNDAPNAINDSATTVKNSPITINVLTNDTDIENDTLSVFSVTNPSNGQAVINQDNTITYTPNNSYVGSDSFNYTITDGNGGFGTATVSITINNINQAPVANSDFITTNEDTQVVINVLANDFDPDGDSLTISIFQQPLNGTAVVNQMNRVVYTPNMNYNGNDSFIYQVSDGQNGFASATVSLTITPVNDPPIANNQSITTQQNTPVNVNLSATDVDNNTLTFTIIASPRNGSLTGSAPNLTYTPNNNFSGNDSFTFVANDGIANSNTATVSITVLPSYTPYSLSFDGNDFARFTDIPLSQQYTYEAWIFRNQDTGSYETFLSDANSNYTQAMFVLYVDGGNRDCSGAPDQFAYYQTGSNSLQCSGVTIQVGQWYHLAVTRDSANTRRMFVNGNLVSTQTNSPNTTNSSGRVNIGRAGDNNSEYFRGMIDAVRISNVARYTANFVPSTSNFPIIPNTVALYHLDAGTGQTLVDSSGNNRNGTRGASTATEASDPTWVNQSPITSN
ncbi:MAG: Ig-like domain-containing protein, partial [Patescibacteria group bacterium]|nr:Ig-like domain-containing protein [Patescibacteria group bacterium]